MVVKVCGIKTLVESKSSESAGLSIFYKVSTIMKWSFTNLAIVDPKS